MDKLTIAIDGLTGTGKSQLAKYLADKLEIKYIDSGIYYRAVMYKAIKAGVRMSDYLGICKNAKEMNLVIDGEKILLDESDVTSELYTLEITNKVTNICKINALRRIINEMLKSEADKCEKGIIIEGKDIGVNVLPDAAYKFFITADISARTARRQQDFLDFGHKIPKDKIEKEIKLRDEFELRKNPVIIEKDENAREIDTSNMILEEQVNHLFRIITNPAE